MMTTDDKLDAILKRLDALEAGEDAAKKRRLEWFRIGIPSGIAVVTIIIGFIQYVSTSSFGSRQPFLLKQTELCLQASEAAARLARTYDKAQWAKSRDDFWMLWTGPLEVVQEAGQNAKSEVANRMIDFGNALKALGASPTLPAEDLVTPAQDVALACRDLLSSKWQTGILGWFGPK